MALKKAANANCSPVIFGDTLDFSVLRTDKDYQEIISGKYARIA